MTPTIPLNPFDQQFCILRLPEPVRNIMERLPVFVAGGFIRAVIAKEQINDVDLWVPNRTVADSVLSELKAQYRHSKTITTDNAYMLVPSKGLPINIIFRWTFDSAQHIIESFDFTACAAVLWFRKKSPDDSHLTRLGWQGLCHFQFYQDLAAKRLVYMMPQREEEAGGSMLRILKYYQKGYRVPLDSLAAVIARLVKGIRPDILLRENEHEIAYTLTGLLREVDPGTAMNHILQDFHMETPEAKTIDDTKDLDF